MHEIYLTKSQKISLSISWHNCKSMKGFEKCSQGTVTTGQIIDKARICIGSIG